MNRKIWFIVFAAGVFGWSGTARAQNPTDPAPRPNPNQPIQKQTTPPAQPQQQQPQTGAPAAGPATNPIQQQQPQVNPRRDPGPTDPKLRRQIEKAEIEGIKVRIKDIARFRGVRGNQLSGIGLVIGLEGTGDTKKTPYTATLVSNALKYYGNMIEANAIDPKNVAVVWLTAELPPFASPGNTIDITVNSMGDASSLQGGTLIQTPLKAIGDSESVYALAQGPISIGGFNVSGNGSKVQKNHVNVGTIPGGAIVEKAAPTQIVFNDSQFFLELERADFTTANRIVEAIREFNPEYQPVAKDPGTIQMQLPTDMSAIEAMSEIELVNVFADVAAEVVVNERTGTITWTGNVRLGPAVVAHGALNVIIDTVTEVSQPAPFSNGETKVIQNSLPDAVEDTSNIAVVPPGASIADLARIFQVLKVTPRDMISILQNLRAQGSLKAKIVVK